MKKITTAQRITIIALLMFGVILSMYLFVYKRIDFMYSELNKIKTELDIMDVATTNRQDTVKLLNNSKTDIEELNKYFVPLKDPAVFLETIESLGKYTGADVEVETLKRIDDVKKGTDDADIKQKVNVEIALSGKWEEVYRTLSLMEKMPYAITINNVVIMAEKESDYGEWSGQVDLVCVAK